MSVLHAIVLGIVQGLTEFLPISSSGHLLVVPWLFDWKDFSDVAVKKAFDVALHAGTLVAVVGYFRHELMTYAEAAVRSLRRPNASMTSEARIAWLIIWSSIPAALAGAVLESWIDETLGTPAVIGVTLVVFAVVLLVADRRKGDRKLEDLSWRQASVIGAAQVLALNPGTSRSGITISAGRFLGLERWSAARFSFLMSLPVTAGAVVFKLAGLVSDGLPPNFLVPMTVGVLASAVSGWMAVAGLLHLVRSRTFAAFVLYRIIAGSVIVIIAATSWR